MIAANAKAIGNFGYIQIFPKGHLKVDDFITLLVG